MLIVHIAWATRHRAPTIEASLDAWLLAFLERKGRRLDCAILAAGCALDHVHVLVQHPTRISVATLVHDLEGASSRALHRLSPPASLIEWQVGYWAETITPRELEPLVHYIRHQRAHHREHPSPEPWEPPA